MALTLADGATEDYDLQGRIVSEKDRVGKVTTYTYDSDGYLLSVTGHFGHTLSFAYDSDGHLSSLTDPDSNTIVYGYDSNDNLATVTYQDGKVRTYHYERSTWPRHALTGITDENGDRYATYTYDSSNRAVSTEHAQTTNAAGQEKYSLSYDSDTQTTITDPFGNTEILNFVEQHDLKKLTSRTHQTDGKGITQTFDADNNLLSRTDQEGRVTTFTYNATNQRISMTEASGTSSARTTSYEYLSADEDLVTKATSPSVYATGNKEVVVVYDANRNVTSVTINGYTPSGTAVSRATTMQYDTHGNVTSINGPRIDLSDIMTLEYYDCSTGAECGQLKKLTNPLGYITTFDTYDAHGHLIQLTDPNGLIASYTYDDRGRVLTIVLTPTSGPARTTTYAYDDLGQVFTVTSPNGTVLTYSYDAAHDLRSITDNFSNKIEYTYDEAGNRTEDTT